MSLKFRFCFTAVKVNRQNTVNKGKSLTRSEDDLVYLAGDL